MTLIRRLTRLAEGGLVGNNSGGHSRSTQRYDVGVGDLLRVQVEVLLDGDGQQRREGIPGPERRHEAKPREEENAAVHVDGVEDRDGPGLVVDWVEVRRPVEVRPPEPSHSER